MTKSLRIPGLLFVGDCPIASFRSYTLQKESELVDQYCYQQNFKCNLSKYKIMVFKKGRKLKATEGWRANGQNTGVVDEFN